MKRRLEFKDGKSNKFWEIELNSKSYTTRYGKIGSEPRSDTNTFTDESKAKEAYEKIIKEKLKKGYIASDSTDNEEVISESPQPSQPSINSDCLAEDNLIKLDNQKTKQLNFKLFNDKVIANSGKDLQKEEIFKFEFDFEAKTKYKDFVWQKLKNGYVNIKDFEQTKINELSFHGFAAEVHAMDYFATKDLLVIGAYNRKKSQTFIYTFNTKTGQINTIHEEPVCDDHLRIHTIKFSLDGNHIYYRIETPSLDIELRRINLTNNQSEVIGKVYTYDVTHTAYNFQINQQNHLVHIDGDSVRVTNLNPFDTLFSFDLSEVSFSKNKKVIDPVTKEIRFQYDYSQADRANISCKCFAISEKNNQVVIHYASDGFDLKEDKSGLISELKIFDYKKNKLIKTIKLDTVFTSFKFHPDKSKLIATEDHGIFIYDLQNEKILHEFMDQSLISPEEDSESITCFAFAISSDQKRLVIGASCGVLIFDLENNQLMDHFYDQNRRIREVIISQDNKLITWGDAGELSLRKISF